MKIATIILVGTAMLTIVNPVALAQEARSGTITEINRLNGTIAIRPTQGGTVGANGGSTAEAFKVQGGLSLDALHAGDMVSFSATDTGATKTITKIQKQ